MQRETLIKPDILSLRHTTLSVIVPAYNEQEVITVIHDIPGTQNGTIGTSGILLWRGLRLLQ